MKCSKTKHLDVRVEQSLGRLMAFGTQVPPVYNTPADEHFDKQEKLC